MSVRSVVPVTEYLETVYRPDREYIDGELLERNVGEWDHSRFQALLSHYLLDRERQWGILAVLAQRVQVNAARFRVPDIVVLTGPPPTSGIVREPPFLCIEILSPRDRMQEMQERVDDYLAFGVPHVWVIQPHPLRAFVYTRDGMHEAKDGVLTTAQPALRVVLSELQ